MFYTLPKRTRRLYAVSAMKQLRVRIEPLWDEIGNLAFPFRVRLNITDQNNAQSRGKSIYNSTATRGLRVLQSGLTMAATDPSSQWVMMTLGDEERASYGPHRDWLDYVGNLVLQHFEDSNLYQNLPTGYGNSACFGMSLMGMEESYGRSVLNTRLYNTGRAWVEQDDNGQINQFYEEHRATIRQLYIRFGPKANFSTYVTHLAERGRWDEWVAVGHLIEPNDEFKPGSPIGREKRYSDSWWEIGFAGSAKSYEAGILRDQYIVESGTDMFPILAGKWSSIDGDVYPLEFPGSECLPDNKSLQIFEKRGWQYIERMVHPHYLIPTGMRGDIDENFTPGGSSFVDEKDAGKSVRPSHMIDPGGITPLGEQVQRVESRILEALHYPTFSTFDSLPDKTPRTATEIIERKAEKLLKLVDMYTNLQVGVLKPLIDFTIATLDKRGLIPPPPPDLEAHLAQHGFKYRFNGVLAQAQKMNRANPIQQVLAIGGQIAQAQGVSGARPEIFDKLNADQALNEIANDFGCPASVMRSDDEVAAIRQQRQVAAEQQAKLQAMEQAAVTAKHLSQAKTGEKNALTALTGA